MRGNNNNNNNNNLTAKIFIRLVLFIFLYLSYLFAFNFTELASSTTSTSTSSSPFLHTNLHKTTNHKPICTNNEEVDELMQTFLPLQTKQLENLNTTGKFIVYSAIDMTGLGNRIPPLVSTFLLSLLTKRGFLVHWPHVNESVNEEQEHIGMVAFHKLFQAPFLFDGGLVPGFYENISADNTVVLSMESIADILLCGDIENLFENVPFVVIYGWRPFFDLLFQNPHYSQKIKELGLHELVYPIAKCLLQPIPEVNEVIQKFRNENNISEHTKLVGIHIRKLSSHGLTDKQEDALWECVRANYPPPPLPSSSSLSSSRSSSRSSSFPFLYFLASDSPESYLRAPPEFRPYIVSVKGDMVRHNVEGLARALADIWILGESVELYGAQGTTFITAVRSLFNTSTHLLSFSLPPSLPSSLSSSSSPPLPSSSHSPSSNLTSSFFRSLPLCTKVVGLPCFKWWDVFRTKKDFSLSCFIQHSPRKPSFLC